MNKNHRFVVLAVLAALALVAAGCSGSDESSEADTDPDGTTTTEEVSATTEGDVDLPTSDDEESDSGVDDATADSEDEGEQDGGTGDEAGRTNDPDAGDCEVVEGDTWPQVEYSLVNLGDEPASYFATFTLYDESGSSVEDTFATVSIVQPGEFVEMSTVVPNSDISLPLDCEMTELDRTPEEADPAALADAAGCDLRESDLWGEIAYEVTNGSAEPTGYWLTFGLYDTNGVRIAEDFATFSQLEPGGSVALATALANQVSPDTECRVIDVEYTADDSDPDALDDIDSCEVAIDFADDAEPTVSVTNTDEVTWDYFMDIGLYDASGVRIAESFSGVDDLGPGETETVTGVTFVAFEEVAECRVLSVTRTES